MELTVPSKIFTNGSGGKAGADQESIAGRRVGVLDNAQQRTLHGMLLCTAWSILPALTLYGWGQGLTRTTQESPQGDRRGMSVSVQASHGPPPHHPRVATIYYDSIHAYRAATYLSKAAYIPPYIFLLFTLIYPLAIKHRNGITLENTGV